MLEGAAVDKWWGPGAARLGGKRLGRLLVMGGTGGEADYDAELLDEFGVTPVTGANWTSREAVVKPRAV
ncbi:hypothetical protein GCM10022235_56910 [Kribbella ginsengisoli]|uniref:Uncharacterized protein n=1 Tax=Kribbella ginsengisoli TaxID=363865 RepID=A0ABP6YAB7_9ACTN